MKTFIAWLMRYWGCRSGHFWREIAKPYVRQCRRCFKLEFHPDTPDDMRQYFATIQTYRATRMFPKTPVKGYHAFRPGCCPLPKEDSIHKRNID